MGGDSFLCVFRKLKEAVKELGSELGQAVKDLSDEVSGKKKEVADETDTLPVKWTYEYYVSFTNNWNDLFL